jgi:hypothetical protein
MLYFVDGKNGSGKSLFAMHRIVMMLECSEKTIITNMEEIVLPELNEFLHKRAAARGVPAPDLDERLVIIRKDETPEYFRYRSGGLVLPKMIETDDMGKRIKVSEFRDSMKEYFKPVGASDETRVGVCYFLDEVQDYFGAREWATNGRAVAWHVSKHRHLDDDIYWMTPCFEEVDAQLKRKAHQWFRLQNQYRMKWKGFRMPGGFKAFLYYGEPRPGVEPSETISFKLGDGYEKTYLTTNALGVRGKPETKPPGWAPPFWLLVCGLCAAVCLAAVVLWSIPKLVGHGLGHAIKAMNAGIHHEIDKSSPASIQGGGGSVEPILDRPEKKKELVSDGRLYFAGEIRDEIGLLVFVVEQNSWVRVVARGDDGCYILPDGSPCYRKVSGVAEK